MASAHMLEYSKSSRAACHGPPPCKGTPIGLGVLRYGAVSQGKYGETVEWRHWGCVTPETLQKLAYVQVDRVPGFLNLRPEDQQKIRLAVGLRRIDPADVPDSAKPKLTATNASIDTTSAGPSQKKRKAAFEAVMTASQSSSSSGPGSSQPRPNAQPSATQRLRQLTGPTATQLAEEAEAVGEVVPEESPDELYCTMNASIVGVQYYKGLVGPGEQVRLVREPGNSYDRNAIKVENIGRTQVGHIPRNIAAKLAPLMDRNLVTVEGVMHEGNLSGFSYSLSMTLKIYGPSDKRAQLEPKLIWATPGQRGFATTASRRAAAPSSSQARGGPSAASLVSGPSYASTSAYPATQSYAGAVARPTAAQTAAQQEAVRKQQEAMQRASELREILNNLEKVDDEGRRSSLLDTLCSTEDVLNLPVHTNPPGIENGDLNVNLLKHQSQALKWCIDREYPTLPKTEADKPVQFWQLRKAGGKSFYFNLATQTPQQAAPTLGRGALCADSMGLGKTLTMLALILATKSDIPSNYSRSTLIVVPVSVLSNWEKQIEDHVRQGALTSCTYYGSTRSMNTEELRKYDIVVTAYSTVMQEFKNGANKLGSEGSSKKKQKMQRTLLDMPWKRVILDEGHTVRNPKTQVAQAVCALNAQRRWVLSGTPIINSPRDLGSILTFLQICRPLDNEDFYKRMVLRPLKDGNPSGAELLRALMSHICIRRTKEMQDSEGNPLVPLPPVEIIVVKVALDTKARELYDTIEELSQDRFDSLVEKHGSINAAAVQSNVLSMLTRMRQLALHPGLLPANYLEKLRAADEDDSAAPAIQLKPEDKIRLQGLLAQAIEDNEECPICFGILDVPRITSCAHMFCLACILEVISRDPRCPMDRRLITTGDLIEPPPPTELTQAPIPRDEDEEDDDLDGLRSGSSAKIDQLVHLLTLTASTEKSLVFSQFTSFLDKIAETLEKKGIPYVRFDGKMSAKRRQETIARFSVPLDEDTPAFVPTQEESSCPSRRRDRSNRAVDVDDSFAVNDHAGDADFTMEVDGDNDSDFIVDDDEDVRPSRKGKNKAKGKSKKPKSGGLDGSAFGEVNPRVMLISLKAGALGLNLTVANNVYLMDPWWQEGIESQAIDRCNRIGQTKPVRVYQMIAENTVESKVIDIQEKKKILIQQAFSGMKNKETQRQKKEARLQELIELFGARRAAAQNSTIA